MGNCGLTEDDIVVLTPYRGQKDCITDSLCSRRLRKIAVKTVNESQGTVMNCAVCLCVCVP